MPTNALILSGGGARAAYQVGVLQAVAEICPNLDNPFPIICGTSAGAINATALAAYKGEFNQAALSLATTWRELSINQVFHSDGLSLMRGVGKILLSLFHEGSSKKKPFALLDNSPLRAFLNATISFENLEDRIASNELEALCITALGYNSGESVSFLFFPG